MRNYLLLFLSIFLCLQESLESDYKYIGISVYLSEYCIQPYFIHQWIFPIPSNCTFGPSFFNFSKLEYDYDNEVILSHEYSDSECEVLNKTVAYNLSTCINVESVFQKRSYYLIFSVMEELPFRFEDQLQWAVIDYFEEIFCENQHTGLYSGVPSTECIDIEKVHIYGMCSDDWAVIPLWPTIADMFLDVNVFGWKFFPQYTAEGYCFAILNDTFFYHYFYYVSTKSMYIRCMNQSELDAKFLSSFPNYSEKKLQIFGKYNDKECTQKIYSQVTYHDHCGDENEIHRSMGNYTYIEFFDNDLPSTCIGSPYKYTFYPIYGGAGNCLYLEENVDDPMQSVYGETKMTDDIYFPREIAYLSNEHITCGESLEEIKKHPYQEKSWIVYYGQDFCISDVDDGSLFNGKYRSIRGSCQDGMIQGMGFTKSYDCIGYYESIENEDLCYWSQRKNFYSHFTCLPRYCDGVSENDYDRVCNGQGDCVGVDICDCNEGFLGQFCEYWECFGIENDGNNGEKICSGHGECNELDSCVCESGFSGEECQNNDIWNFGIILISTSVPVLSIIFIILFLVMICCACICFCSYVIIVLIICLCSGISIITLLQKRRLSKFGKLDNFEIILKEQLLMRDSSIAHLKINKDLFEIPYEELRIVEVLGQGGSNSTVYLAKWKNEEVVFKCYRTNNLGLTGQADFDQFEAELSLLSSLSHPNIIRFYGASLKPPRVGIVMEYCEHGEILSFLVSYRKSKKMRLEEEEEEKTTSSFMYPLDEKIRMMFEVSKAMEFVHNRKIIHRDLKGENVLVTKHQQCKLMDFGISRFATERNEKKTKRVGTKHYMAPEILTGHYDRMCDSFSFSILVYLILTEKINPYRTLDRNSDLYNNNDGSFQLEFRVANDPTFRPQLEDVNRLAVKREEEAPEWLLDIIQKCWSHDPSKRYNFSQLSKIFLTKMKKKNDAIFEMTRDDGLSEKHKRSQSLNVNFLRKYKKKKKKKEKSMQNTFVVEYKKIDDDDEVGLENDSNKEKEDLDWRGKLEMMQKLGREIKKIGKEKKIEEILNGSVLRSITLELMELENE